MAQIDRCSWLRLASPSLGRSCARTSTPPPAVWTCTSTFPEGPASPHCGGQPACPVHDTEPKTWRHLDFFQHHAYLLDAVARQRTRFGACWHG